MYCFWKYWYSIWQHFNDLLNDDILALEVSSFQLDKIINLKFHIAVLLNISKDHLDWHGSWEEYIQSKLKIFKNQDEDCFAIICIDDKNCESIAKNFDKRFISKLIKISTKKKINNGIYLEQKQTDDN